MGRTNMRYPYPEAGGISQPQRAAGQPLPFTTEKHTGSGIEPGVSDCEATVFPRRHCTPLLYGVYPDACWELLQSWNRTMRLGMFGGEGEIGLTREDLDFPVSRSIITV